MVSTTGSAISPRDFNRDTKDPQRDEWSAGAMQHLVKALDGKRVAVVCDKRTGFAEVNVTLGGVRANGRGHWELLVQRTYADGKTDGCWYLLFQVGTVMVLDRQDEGLGARYTAYESYSKEQARAIRKLQDSMMADLGVDDRYNLPRGKWEARSLPDKVHASFTPEKLGGPDKYMWAPYTTAELANAE